MNTDKQRQDAYWKKTKELSNKIEKLINNGVNMKTKKTNKTKLDKRKFKKDLEKKIKSELGGEILNKIEILI